MEKVIPAFFSKSAEEYKANTVFNYFDGEWKSISYENLSHSIKSIAADLLKRGIRKGDKIAIISENRYEWCTAYLAISFCCAVAVPMDAQLGPDEIRNLLADSESKLVFHSDKTKDNLEMAVSRDTSSPLSVVAINFDSGTFKDMLLTPALGEYPGVLEDDIASLIYTSGTTGIPKGVLLTHRNFCSDAEAIMQIGLIEPGDSFLAILPYHHTYPFMGNFILPVAAGLTVTFPRSLKGPELVSTIREKGVTILVSVPQLLELIRNGIVNKIRQLPGPLPPIMLGILQLCGSFRRSTNMNIGKTVFKSAHKALGKRFKFFASGGAKLNPEVMKDMEALGFTVLEGYGLTETAPVVTFNSPLMKRKPGSIGKPLPTAEIRIIKPETGKEAGSEEEGEIVIKGPMVMKGYYKNPEATEQVLKDGWFFSGDLGYRDEDGYIFVTGRLKEVIVLSSGKNVYPEEVEGQYQSIPLIKELCVMGIEERGLVESLQAVIVPDLEYARKSQIGNVQETLKWEISNISRSLPSFMRIKGFTIYPYPLPRTPLGKLRRFMVKDLLKVKGEKLKAKSEDKRLMEDEIGKKVIECIKPLLKAGVPVQSGDSLELDLGLDSLARIELVVSLEKVFSLKLPET
ncbi:MAG: AMP-binding protein, partial [Nitrospirota bacterium]